MRSSRPARTRVLLLAAGLLTLSALGTAPADADSTPVPGAGGPTASPALTDEEAPLRINVARLLPRAPVPGQAFEVSGTVTNVGSRPAMGITVQVRIGDRIFTRSGLRDADRDRPPTSWRASTVLAKPDLAPGQTTTFDLRTLVDRLLLGDAGVYPLDIEATARYGDAGRARLGIAPTFLPWMGGRGIAPTRVAVLWPLVDEPHRGPDDELLDDDLATRLSSQGRLGRQLAVASAARRGACDAVPQAPMGGVVRPVPSALASRCEAAPVTFAVDPDLLQTARAMTSPYTVSSGSGPARPGAGSAQARAWLAELTAATAGAPVLALPFADPDVAALSRTLPGRYDLGLAGALGSQLVTDQLGRAPLASVVWPPAGPVPPTAVDALVTQGVPGPLTLVLDPTALAAPLVDLGATPDAHVPLPRPITGQASALVSDPDLSNLVAGRSAADVGPRLAEQRWIAETAIIATERPSQSRTLLVAPDRRGDVVPAAAAPALQDIGRLPWLCPVSLADAASDRETCTTTRSGAPPPPPKLGDLLLDGAGQLSGTFLARVGTSRDHATQFTDQVLDPSDPAATQTSARLRRAVARAESSAWRSDGAGGRQSADRLRQAVARLENGLTVQGAPLLLTSTKGTLSVGVDNRLDVPVTCAVAFDLVPGASLSSYRTPVQTIPAHHSAQLSVQATARTSGRFPVTAHLVGRDGRPFGDPARFVVRSTQYGRLALAVTGVGAGVLLVAAGFRIVRRATGRGPTAARQASGR